MKQQTKVTIREVALRDGLQSIAQFVPTEKKLEIIRSLAGAGITVLETTSFVSPKAIPQLQDAAELLKQADRANLSHEVMVPNLKGAQRAVEAKADCMIVFVSASEEHNQANVKRSIADSLSDLDEIFQLGKENGIPVVGAIAVSFGCPYRGDVPIGNVLKIAEHFAKRGAQRVSLGDTTGMATPAQIEEAVKCFRQALPHTQLCLHLHNNRGTAILNLYAGLNAGVKIFDTALGGIGGCPNVPLAAGNLPTEDIVYLLSEMDIDTGIDLNKTIKAAITLEKILGFTLPGQVMKSGPRDPNDAFHRDRKLCI